MGDFTVDTNKCCFLCSDRIIPQYQPMKQECGSPLEEASSLHSLQYLSHYLKLDKRKVFTEEEDVSHHLLLKVKNSRLKVKLCVECTNLNEMFSNLYQKLNKIEMEVGSCLRRIHCKLMRGTQSEDGNEKNVLNLGDSCDNEGQLLEGKRQIATLLRSEMIQKCSPKISDVLPIVKLQKLTMNQVNTSRRKMANRRKRIMSASRTTSSQRMLEKVQLKFEKPDQDPLHDEGDDVGSPPLGFGHDHDPQSEDEEANYLDNPTAPTMNSGSKAASEGRPSNTPFRVDHYKSVHCKIEYNCRHCDRKFSHASSLSRHQTTAHKGIRFKCDMCHKMYTQKPNLMTHIQIVHNKQAKE